MFSSIIPIITAKAPVYCFSAFWLRSSVKAPVCGVLAMSLTTFSSLLFNTTVILIFLAGNQALKVNEVTCAELHS